MRRFIQNIKNIWKTEELKKRILYTLLMILLFRLGSYIMIPGVDSSAVNSDVNGDNGILGNILGTISGGAFDKLSIMSLGIMPYISASIIMQLLGLAVPAVQKMQNEGESGRKRINTFTRVLTIAICAAQAPFYISSAANGGGVLGIDAQDAMPTDMTSMWWVAAVTSMIGGTMIATWIGERITDKGIGNGVSLLIAVGILARFPDAVLGELNGALKSEVSSLGLLGFVLKALVFGMIVLGTIAIVQAVRKIGLETAKRIVGARAVGEQGARNYIPLKVNATGVMPIIFAQAVMAVPAYFIAQASFNPRTVLYNVVLASLIIVFNFLYTAIMISPRKMADDLKRGGAFIPGVKAGEDTQHYIDSLLTRITLPGSLFLAAIAILPGVAMYAKVGDGFAAFFGGTSLLIMVGVVLDTLQQIESHLLNKNLDGLMEGSRVRGRRDIVPSGM
jgi:preprotein translocase subunit SecY